MFVFYVIIFKTLVNNEIKPKKFKKINTHTFTYLFGCSMS